MEVSDWDKWQSYRSDRGTPPWIKVYRNLLSNEEWVGLTDSEKGQLVSIWILAADKKGVIPDNPKIVMKMCALDSPPNLNKFKDLGFLTSDGCHDDVNLASSGCHVDAPETETETDKIRVEEPLSPKADLVSEIFNFWVTTMGKMPATAKLTPKRRAAVKARIKSGYTVGQIKAAILGCSNDPFSMGENDRNKPFNDLELICRSGEKLESFIESSVQQPHSHKARKTIDVLTKVELN